jgi:heat shock protein HspQ
MFFCLLDGRFRPWDKYTPDPPEFKHPLRALVRWRRASVTAVRTDADGARRPDCRTGFDSLFPRIATQSMDKRPGAALAHVQGLIEMLTTQAKYNLGQVVRHKKHPFGVSCSISTPSFPTPTNGMTRSPRARVPRKGQPFYHLLAENDHTYYVAYVSEQNLIPDETGEPVDHPDLGDLFGEFSEGRYPLEYQLN